jgi:hypothetical protein
VRPFENQNVARHFESYPPEVRKKLLALRELIFKTAAATDGVGELEETLKWGEPAYLTSQSKSGSTIRIDWKHASPDQYAIYFNCQTTLVETFRTLFPKELAFEGNRAVVFDVGAKLPTDAVTLCVAAALTYHKKAEDLSRGTRRTRGKKSHS